jgi:DNA repair protein RecN (Recombination protein N)
LITRVYLKDCLSFEEVELEFKNGLNIFTGPSGAGKSILMQAILSLFALADVKADLEAIHARTMSGVEKVYSVAPISWQSYIGNPLIKKEEKDMIKNQNPKTNQNYFYLVLVC